MGGAPQTYQQIAPDVKLGKGVRIYAFTNLYGCEIGDEVKIGTFVESKGKCNRVLNLSPLHLRRSDVDFYRAQRDVYQ